MGINNKFPTTYRINFKSNINLNEEKNFSETLQRHMCMFHVVEINIAKSNQTEWSLDKFRK